MSCQVLSNPGGRLTGPAAERRATGPPVRAACSAAAGGRTGGAQPRAPFGRPSAVGRTMSIWVRVRTKHRSRCQCNTHILDRKSLRARCEFSRLSLGPSHFRTASYTGRRKTSPAGVIAGYRQDCELPCLRDSGRACRSWWCAHPGVRGVPARCECHTRPPRDAW